VVPGEGRWFDPAPGHVVKKYRTFEDECDDAYRDETAWDAAARAERIRSYETSAEQADWDSDEDDTEEGWEV
jgi:hypothetical protein